MTKSHKGPSAVGLVLVVLAAMAAGFGCGDDKNDDEVNGAGKGNAADGGSGADGGEDDTAGGTGGKPSQPSEGGAGGESNEDPVDYTTCLRQADACDVDAELDFDFTGKWDEALVFTSNDCDAGLQSLLPPSFMAEGITLDDVIIGNCFRPSHDSTEYTGYISLDLSVAKYCTESQQEIEMPAAKLDLVSHVEWNSIESDKIAGTSAVYVAQAGCTLVGDYSLTRVKE